MKVCFDFINQVKITQFTWINISKLDTFSDSHRCFQNCPFFAPLERSEWFEARGEYRQYPKEKNAMF